ncbi:hypothetical protein MKI84_01205 [Ancylobacter sp. A5.8]|nr:hypothetical protein [Ancylobacter gelatini]MCJ8141529.1 hypothetical protein [Ancylobacter gelatini]
MSVSLGRLFLIAKELCVVACLYLALMVLPALYLVDAVWNGGRLVSIAWP